MRTEPPNGDEMARLLASAKGGLMAEARRTPRRRPRTELLVGSLVAAVLLIVLVTGGALVAFTGGPAPFAGPGPTPATSAPPTDATPAPDESGPTSTESATEPADRLAAVTTIVVRAEGLDFEDAAGEVVTSTSYDDDTGLIVGTLTAVLGEVPTVEEEGAEEYLAYAWPGIRVSDDLGEGPGRMPTNVAVKFTLPVVGDGVAVTTQRGVAPGDDLAAYLADEPIYPGYPETIGIVALETGPELGPPSSEGVPNAYAVVASDSVEEDGIASVVSAPVNLGTAQQFGF